jgi:acyl transferase domain-containing protein/acyl carrier protein
MPEENIRSGLEIAIIGMSGRFPGANSVDEFWDNLQRGVNSIRFFSREELLEKSQIDPFDIQKPNFVAARGVVDNLEYFDAFFFGYSPTEAEILDPQIRVFYEICWEALEDAGCDPSTYKGIIGVYAGGTSNRWWEVLTIISGKTETVGRFASDYLIDKDFVATRMAYKLDLKGPAVTLHTACSTALVSVDLGCRAMLTGQCDAVLAGGASTLPQTSKAGGYLYEEGMIRSPDGYVRAFDVRAKGVVFSDGAGVVFLKRLTDALADGDHIYAVIKGFATNNDGIGKSSFSAPGVDGQREVVRSALYMAEVNPESIGYIEAHGTGTEIGDPIELEALNMAFNTNKRHFCAIGSVKPNIGHLDSAAGISSLIKACLALTHRQIPPTLNFETSNPKIDFENSPFFVNTELRRWENSGSPLRAGVSSFGVGGTNAHLVLEEAPVLKPSSASRFYQLIVLSARTKVALGQVTLNFLDYLKSNPAVNIADVAFTLQAGRKAFEHRKMLVCRDVQEAVDILSSDVEGPGDSQRVHTSLTREEKRVVFMFPGQGSQYVNMTRGLYEIEAVFREEMDRCFKILDNLLDVDIKGVLYSGHPSQEGIDGTGIAQPVIFAIEYALARLLMAWGVTPYAMIGHSIGEYTAACLAGVFSLEDALAVVAWRGRLMQQMPPGGMLSVPLPENEVVSLLPPALSLAAVNGPSYCVVSGPHEAIDAFARQLDEKGQQYRRLHTSHAFHSAMMEPILEAFEEKVAQVKRNEPRIPFISNVTGQWVTYHDAVDPKYWSRHLRSPVRFADGMGELLKEKHLILVEVGPGNTLSTFARQHPAKQLEQMPVNLVRHPKEDVSDGYYLLDKIGRIWLYGKQIDWRAFYAGERRHRLRLPTYPFQRQPYWVEGNPFRMIREGMRGRLGAVRKANIAEWFYIPSWVRSVVSTEGKRETGTQPGWLVFGGHCGFADRLVKTLTGAGKEVTVVRMGEKFARSAENVFTLSPGQPDDYEALIEALKTTGRLPGRILHLWNLGDQDDGELREERVDRYLELGFYSLLYLAKALANQDSGQPIEMTVLTNGMQEVWDDRVRYPEKAALLGPVLIVPREHQNIHCRCIDIVLPKSSSGDEEWLMDRLLREFCSDVDDSQPLIAYRGRYRLKRTYEPAPFPEPDSLTPRLKTGGVYLITGGLGGIGLVLARHLARTVQARLILTGRSALPDREEWEAWLNAHGSLDETSQKIRNLKELESLGAEVLAYRTDVSDAAEMGKVVEGAMRRFNTLNGVIHAAGVPGGGVIQLKTREMADRVLAAKVKGTVVLNDVLKGIELDFILLCSSINAVVPIFGQVDYCGANAFLDAFAFYKNTMDKTLTVSINWDAWKEVGMAVVAARQFSAGESSVSAEPQPSKHPLFDHYREISHNDGSKKFVYSTYFSVERHFVLSDHMTRQGKGLVPGVTYLEMAAAAFGNLKSDGAEDSGGLEIRGVSFLNTLILDRGSEREARTIVKQEGNGCRFLVQSRVNPGEDAWQDHAAGEVLAAAPEEKGAGARIHDLRSLEAECPEVIDIEVRRRERSEEDLLVFGPRWGNVKMVRVGKNKGLALLELPESFSGDLQHFTLHPAMLDNAVAFLYGHINSKSPYIPYSYKKLTVFRPLPARIYSCSRLIEDDQSSQGFLRFGVIIMDEEGRELVDIEEFTMLEVSDEILDRLKEKEQERASGQRLQPADSLTGDLDREEFVRDGISPVEGVAVFNRILAESMPQVVVSTLDLQARLENSLTVETSQMAEGMRQATTADSGYSRPDISSEYAAPATTAEQKLAAIWQEILGIDRVGVNDDFFELGGDSLKANMMMSRIKKELNVSISIGDIFNTPWVKQLAEKLGSREESEDAYFAVELAEKREYYPLSPIQRRFYIMNEIAGIGAASNLNFAMMMEGRLDREKLERAFCSLIQRHESLRTSFVMLQGEPVQVIHQDVDFGIESISAPEAETDTVIEKFVRPFDLTEAPLLRVGVVRFSEERYLLMMDVHHIVSDAISFMVMIRELTALYEGKELPPLRVHYRDFSLWHSRQVGKAAMRRQEEFWLGQFKDGIPVLEIFADYPRPPVQSFGGETIHFEFDGALMEKVNRLMRETDTTLYMVLLAAFTVTLSKYSGQDDIVVGSPVSGRDHPDFENIVGVFINAVAMRNYPAGEKTFLEFLNGLKDNTLKAYENQGYPIGQLIERLDAGRDISRNPLYDAELVIQNMERPMLKLGDLKFSSLPYDTRATLLDIFLEAWDLDGKVTFNLRYGRKLFKRETMAGFVEFFKKIVSTVVENRQVRLKEITLPQDIEMARSTLAEDMDGDFGF